MKIKLEELTKASSFKQNLEYNASVLAMANESFMVPCQLSVVCTESKMSASGNPKTKCLSCPLYRSTEEAYELTLLPSDLDHAKAMVNIIQKSENMVKKEFHRLIGCPHPSKCRDVQIEEIAQQAIKPALIETHLDDVKAGHLSVQTKMFLMGDVKLDVSSRYLFKGTMVYDNETRHSLPMAYEAVRTTDSIESFNADSEENKELLSRFKPETEDVVGLAKFFRDYYNFIGNRVSHIRGRHHIGMAADLVYHSVLQFKFNSRLLEKGWLEGTIIGDTSTGKTETVRSLARWYGCGEFISSGETASRAGLLGGIRSIQGQQVIEWGKLPRNDKQIVIIDEADTLSNKGTGNSIMAELTDVRRSGIATITKTISGSAPARTRIIWISNKPNGGNIDPSTEAVKILPELFGASQDVARVDLACVAMKDDVSPEDINEPFPDDNTRIAGDDRFTKEACNARVLFAWTRKPDDIVIPKEVELGINNKAKSMSDNFTLDIPLVADIKIKLARMAVSIACMTYSTDDGKRVLVRSHHVDYAYKWLIEMYRLLKYDSFSRRLMLNGVMDLDSVNRLNAVFKFSHEAQTFLNADKITDYVIADAFNCPVNDIGETKKILKACGCFKEWQNGQRVKTPAFTKYLTDFIRVNHSSYNFIEERNNGIKTENGFY